ncbi:MAG: hypothetical protein ACRDZR_08100 [Acidimicrobiales bacterium]
MAPPPESSTHRLAVLRQDNGELAEDVVSRAGPVPAAGDDHVDDESEASFPASDPPSDWAGADDAPDTPGDDRLVGSGPVDHVPGTLPRTGTDHPATG